MVARIGSDRSRQDARDGSDGSIEAELAEHGKADDPLRGGHSVAADELQGRSSAERTLVARGSHAGQQIVDRGQSVRRLHLGSGHVVLEATAAGQVGHQRRGEQLVALVGDILSEAEVHWRDFLASLQARGLTGVEYVVSDDHSGIKQALRIRLTGVPWQRCQFHLAQNALHYAPTSEMRRTVAAGLRRVLNAADRREAEERLARLVAEHRKAAPKLAAWLETNVPESLTVFSLPEAHRRRLRTTNGLERLNKEIKRRTRVATLFPNEASLLRLVTAVLMEVSEEWETGKIYLTFNQLHPQLEKENA